MKMTKEQLKMSAQFTVEHTEENLKNQINQIVNDLENMLNTVKKIYESNCNLEDKAGRILTNIQWSTANLNIDTIIQNVYSYKAATIKLEAFNQYDDAE